mmetsp:Transcript_46877/g.149676  ORF Transcript_46877/g.149676 Transcript_46877/m.149676 type:complete len:576 (-) Transcript_46877:72-1799(-)
MSNSTEPETPLTAHDAARLAAQAAARYYQRANSFRFQPFRSWDQFLVLCGLIAGLVALIYYWRTVLKCVVGDSVIRCDRFYCLYWGLFQCCGCCDGEWTRCISSNCCCMYEEWRGRNLKRLLGESIGIYPMAVRVQNIVVGSLPQDHNAWFPRSPDVFVQIVADELQPTLNTEVVTEANTECVQFTSNLTLLLKNNPSDEPVRFTVKKMLLTGSADIAECSVAPDRLIAWAQRGRKVRIQMGGACRRDDPLCMPWILMDLSVPLEGAFLRKEVGAFSPIISTAAELEGGHLNGGPEEEEEEEDVATMFCGRTKGHKGYVNLPMRTATGFAKITDPKVFQDSYPLVNDKGVQMYEPDNWLGASPLRARSCTNILVCWFAAFFFLYLLLRIFSIGCFEGYRELEVVWLYSRTKHQPFDASGGNVDRVLERACKGRTAFLWRLPRFVAQLHHDKTAEEMETVCAPHTSQTVKRCADLHGAPQPRMLSISCPGFTCQLDQYLQNFDLIFFLVMLLACVVLGTCKWWEIKERRKELALAAKGPIRQRYGSPLPSDASPYGSQRSPTTMRELKVLSTGPDD